MRLARNTYQHGWIETGRRKSTTSYLVYRWREKKPDCGYMKRSEVIGPVSMLNTEANAWRVIEHRKLDVNSDCFQRQTVTIGMLVNRYLETELSELRHSTSNAYRSYLNHQIKPRWGDYPLSKVKPFAVEQWLKGLGLAPRTKGHLHNLMRVLLELRDALGAHRNRGEPHEARASPRHKQTAARAASAWRRSIPSLDRCTR